MRVGIDELRGMAVVRSLFRPTTLGRALRKLGFVQADPIRAPARSQDLTLRQSIGIIAWVSVFGTEKRRYGKFPRGPVGGAISRCSAGAGRAPRVFRVGESGSACAGAQGCARRDASAGAGKRRWAQGSS